MGFRRNTVALVVIVAAVLYLGPLFLDAPLTDPDEGLHAAIAQEMHDRGDLIVPRFTGRPFLDKPILFFWTQAASIGVLGDSTAAARLPGMLFALLGIATTGWLARTLLSRQPAAGSLGGQRAAGSGQGGHEEAAGGRRPVAGWLAAGCYATMALPFLLAQAPVHDMALVPFTTIAFGALWKARPTPNSQFPTPRGQLAIAGFALGLSILTKGLEGVAIVGVGYGLYLLIARLITWRLVMQGVIVLAIAAAIALPWYLAMEAREPGYLRYYFVDRHLLGFATDTQRHGGQPWWFYLPLAVGGGLPWILYLKGEGDRGKGEGLLLWTWLLGGLMLLSLSNSKAVTYVLPVMPAIAILASRSWTAAADAADWLRARMIAHAALFLIIAALAPWAANRFANRPVSAGELVAFGALSVAWLWLLWVKAALRRAAAADAWPKLVIATAATYVLAFALLGPPLAQAHSARDLATYFNAEGRLPATIYIMDGRVSFVYYLRPDLRATLRGDQIQSVSVEQLAALQPFPRDAIVALPADLAGRLSGVPQLAGASHRAAGRYVVVGGSK